MSVQICNFYETTIKVINSIIGKKSLSYEDQQVWEFWAKLEDMSHNSWSIDMEWHILVLSSLLAAWYKCLVDMLAHKIGFTYSIVMGWLHVTIDLPWYTHTQQLHAYMAHIPPFMCTCMWTKSDPHKWVCV